MNSYMYFYVCLQCPEQCIQPVSPLGWYSNIVIDNSNSPIGINLTWMGYNADSIYVIQYRVWDSSLFYTTITDVR